MRTNNIPTMDPGCRLRFRELDLVPRALVLEMLFSTYLGNPPQFRIPTNTPTGIAKGTVELKDGTDVLQRRTIYINKAGQPLLTILETVDGDDTVWSADFYEYNSAGLLVLHADTAALDLLRSH